MIAIWSVNNNKLIKTGDRSAVEGKETRWNQDSNVCASYNLLYAMITSLAFQTFVSVQIIQ